MQTEKKTLSKGVVIALVIVVVVVIGVIFGVRIAKNKDANAIPSVPDAETKAPEAQDSPTSAPAKEQPTEQLPAEEQPAEEQPTEPPETDAPEETVEPEPDDESPALLENGGEITIVIPEGMGSGGF